MSAVLGIILGYIIGGVVFGKIFTKAGYKGWAAFVPFYDIYIKGEIAKKGWRIQSCIAYIGFNIVIFIGQLAKANGYTNPILGIILFIICLYGIIMYFRVYFNIGKRFVSESFGVLNCIPLINVATILYMAFGSCTYKKEEY